MNHNHQHFYQPVHQGAPSFRDKWAINITSPERTFRVLIGIIGTVGGALLLAATPTLITGTLEVLLIVAGLDMIITGATGHCPLYKKLGRTLR